MDAYVQTCREFDYANGIVVNLEDAKSQTVTHVPHTILPSPFPRKCFYNAYAVAIPFQLLYFNVANDFAFLRQCLQEAAKSDEFTAHLLSILSDVEKQKGTQPVQCAVLRSDYMLHESNGEQCIKQVEINTISASFAGLSARVTQLHQHVLRHSGKDFRSVPENKSDKGLARTLYEAWKAYGRFEACILFVVQDFERNKYDQLHIQFLLEKKGVKVIRKSLPAIADCTERSEVGSTLVVDDFEVAVVYFRAGYGPGDYPNEHAWAGRRRIELSQAIKVPTVAWQLAGAKKVQQELARPELLARFTADAAEIARTFVHLTALDSNSVADALSRPGDYVLKPQREGGGNNLYDAEMTAFLKSSDKSVWPAYILMQKIRSSSLMSNSILRNNEILSGECISELGVYSGLVVNTSSKTFLYNQAFGHLLRTKFSTSNETGVSAGFGALDSPNLV